MSPPAPSHPNPDPAASRRLVYVDFFRGLLMMHMALDHVSEFLHDGSRFAGEYAFGPAPVIGDLGPFLTRFSGVVVAPAFCFLAGFSVALLDSWSREPRPTRRLLIRVAVLLGCQLLLNLILPQPLLYGGVLYCLATSLLVVVLVRGLPAIALAGLGLVIILGHPWLAQGSELSLGSALLFRSGQVGEVTVFYPLLPWLGVMLFGVAVGRDAIENGPVQRLWLPIAAVWLVLFWLVRWPGGYGNAFEHAGPTNAEFWLFAKYPPDLVFLAWSFTWIFFSLWLFRRLETGGLRLPRLVMVFGRVALFFYVVHFFAIAALSSIASDLPLPAIFATTALVLVLLYPLCRRYLELRRSGRIPFTIYL